MCLGRVKTVLLVGILASCATTHGFIPKEILFQPDAVSLFGIFSRTFRGRMARLVLRPLRNSQNGATLHHAFGAPRFNVFASTSIRL